MLKGFFEVSVGKYIINDSLMFICNVHMINFLAYMTVCNSLSTESNTKVQKNYVGKFIPCLTQKTKSWIRFGETQKS